MRVGRGKCERQRRRACSGTSHERSGRGSPPPAALGGLSLGAEAARTALAARGAAAAPASRASLFPAAPRPHGVGEGAAGRGAGEAQRRPAAALEEEALPAEREGAAPLRGRRPRLDALQGARLRARQGRRVRGVEAAAHLLHGGDGRRRRDRLPLLAGGAQLERRHHPGAGALQEPAGGAGGARPAQLQGRISGRGSPNRPASSEWVEGGRPSAQHGKGKGAADCECNCQWTEGNFQLQLTMNLLAIFCGIPDRR